MVEKLFPQIPKTMIQALLHAREGDGKGFDEELTKYCAVCNGKNVELPAWWRRLLEGLAQGKTLVEIMDELTLYPYGFVGLNILQNLKAHGFPNNFLNTLIDEATPTIGEAHVLRESIGL